MFEERMPCGTIACSAGNPATQAVVLGAGVGSAASGVQEMVVAVVMTHGVVVEAMQRRKDMQATGGGAGCTAAALYVMPPDFVRGLGCETSFNKAASSFDL